MGTVLDVRRVTAPRTASSTAVVDRALRFGDRITTQASCESAVMSVRRWLPGRSRLLSCPCWFSSDHRAPGAAARNSRSAFSAPDGRCARRQCLPCPVALHRFSGCSALRINQHGPPPARSRNGAARHPDHHRRQPHQRPGPAVHPERQGCSHRADRGQPSRPPRRGVGGRGAQLLRRHPLGEAGRERRRVTAQGRPDPGHRPGATKAWTNTEGAKRTRQVITDAEIGACLRFTTLEVARGGRAQLTSVS